MSGVSLHHTGKIRAEIYIFILKFSDETPVQIDMQGVLQEKHAGMLKG